MVVGLVIIGIVFVVYLIMTRNKALSYPAKRRELTW